MSKNKDKIIEALRAKGYQPTDIVWTQPFGQPIMCGPEGGWLVEFEPMEAMNQPDDIRGYNVAGYSTQEVLEEIQELPDCRHGKPV